MCVFLCKFKDVLGVPGEGVHKQRLFGLAAFDVIATIILSILISFWSNINVFLIIVLLFIMSIGVHKIFCVDTAIMRLLDIN